MVRASFSSALLDAGAKVEVPDAAGMTPLMLAVANDRQDIDAIRLLLARGADVNAKSLAGETALDWAVEDRDETPQSTCFDAPAGAETAHAPVAIPVPAAAA